MTQESHELQTLTSPSGMPRLWSWTPRSHWARHSAMDHTLPVSSKSWSPHCRAGISLRSPGRLSTPSRTSCAHSISGCCPAGGAPAVVPTATLRAPVQGQVGRAGGHLAVLLPHGHGAAFPTMWPGPWPSRDRVSPSLLLGSQLGFVTTHGCPSGNPFRCWRGEGRQAAVRTDLELPAKANFPSHGLRGGWVVSKQ